MAELYENLEWDIGELPISSSTPDELFELSYRAEAKCPSCGDTIHGTANYWSRDESMVTAWLNSIDYEPCDCENKHADEEYEDDDDF